MDRVDDILCDHRLVREILCNLVGNGVHAHTADTDIRLIDRFLQRFFKFLFDIGNAGLHFHDIVDAAFADECCRRFLRYGKDLNTSVGLLLACDAGHF